MVDNTSSPQCPPVTSLTFASSDRQARSPRQTLLIAELGDEVPAIADAAGSIASEQVRNVATLGGNLAQAKRCLARAVA